MMDNFYLLLTDKEALKQNKDPRKLRKLFHDCILNGYIKLNY